jgi:hypothetical protein
MFPPPKMMESAKNQEQVREPEASLTRRLQYNTIFS